MRLSLSVKAGILRPDCLFSGYETADGLYYLATGLRAAGLALGVSFLPALYHLLTFFLPRRQGQPSPAYALFLRLLLPGSLGLGGGLGVVLLLLAAYGLWALLQGSSYLYLAAAYGLHLLLVLSSRAWRRCSSST